MRQKRKQVITGVLVSITVGMILVGEKSVKAATVNYNLEDVYLQEGGELTGTLTYDTGAMSITGEDIRYTSPGGLKETFNDILFYDGNLIRSTPHDGGQDGDELILYLNQALTGGNETVGVFGQVYNAIVGQGNHFNSGSVVATNPVTPTPVPEPGTILGSVAALAMGVVIRGKKKLSSAQEKTRSAPM